MLLDMLYRHLVTLFLILLFSIKLWSRKSFRNTETRYFWLTVISCLMLVVEDTLEVMAETDSSLRFWRILLSVLGYTFRSTAALGLLLVIVRREKRSFVLWIPALITLLVSGTAFFTDVAFGFDGNYAFYRGPLGYVVFIVPVLYLVLILWNTFRYFTERKGAQKYIVPIACVFCMTASVADSLTGGIRLNEAIMISCVFFYIFLYSHDNRRDPLTDLLNRQSFYDDCAIYNKSVRAAASLDMNGLKELNDNYGHSAGDEALVRIGECLRAETDRDTLAYRIGGDEFAVLFFHDREETITHVIEQVRENVTRSGYSISAGYALRGDRDLDETIRESDRRMYENKAKYYRESNHDRRSR